MEREVPWSRRGVVLTVVVSLLLLPVAFAGVKLVSRQEPAPAAQLERNESAPPGSVDHEESCIHVVRRGESLSRIAARYSTTRSALVKTNRLAKPAALRVGQRLHVPGCMAQRRAHTLASTADGKKDSAPETQDSTRGSADSIRRVAFHPGRVAFVWPVHGALTSRFGRRGLFHWHTGVDIKAERGTPIRAAAPGTVTFSGWESSYGEVVKIAHAGGFSTLYAHNRRNFVRVGDRVNTGTVIAAVGRTGDATGYHLHFEIRRHGLPTNPLAVLERREPRPTMVARSDSRAPVTPIAVSASGDRAF